MKHPRRRRQFSALVAAALMPLVLAVATPAHAESVKNRGPAAKIATVALGDSYASGEGLAPYEAATDTAENQCHRSATQSYPEVLERLRPRTFGNLTSVTCSGALTGSLFADIPDRANEPAQLGALSPATTLVTLTIGGNDAGFVPALADCAYSPIPEVQQQLVGAPGCRYRADALISARIAALGGLPGAPSFPGTVPLPNVLAAIHQAAPNAKIIVTGYPTLFGSRPTDAFGCQVSQQGIYLTAADASWISDKAKALNATIRGSVHQARKAGVDVHYANVSRKFKNHNLCDRGKAWVNPIVFTPTNPPQLSTASFHPTVRGQLAFAGAVSRAAGHPCGLYSRCS